MNNTIKFSTTEKLILQQTIIRYLKLIPKKSYLFKLDVEVLNEILTKLGVMTPKRLIKEAKQRWEANE